MITPSYLKSGDPVGLVAPAGKVRPEALEQAIRIIEAWGYEVRKGKHLRNNNHTYFSARDVERLHDVQWALDDPELKAVFCARGGYGTTRIIDDITFTGIVQYPKWVIGFSDITSLHLALQSQGIQSIHGAMPSQFAKPEAKDSVDSLYQLLQGNPQKLTCRSRSNRSGVATGVAIGGNLSLMADSLGTSIAPNTKGKILILEEVDEYAYKIDRMLMHLKRAGKLENLAGLVIGYMTGIESSIDNFGEDLSSIVLEKVRDYDYPVAFRFPVGHEHPNIAWIQGSSMELSVSGDAAILSPVHQEIFPQPPPPGV